MRLFVAFDLPDSIKQYLEIVQKQLPQAKMSLARSFHLTLQFLGECSGNSTERIIHGLSGVTCESMQVQLQKEINTFGSPPRVVWVSLEVPPALFAVARAVTTSLKPLGFIPDTPFVPHITLARIKQIPDAAIFQEALKKIPLEPFHFTLSQFHLFQSVLSPHGAVYHTVATFPQGAGQNR